MASRHVEGIAPMLLIGNAPPDAIQRVAEELLQDPAAASLAALSVRTFILLLHCV